VKIPTDGIVHDPLFERLIRCNSGTDGTVRMGKDFLCFLIGRLFIFRKRKFPEAIYLFGFRKFLFQEVFV